MTGELSDYDRKQVAEFEAGANPIFISAALLDELARLGRIEPGVYLVRISW